jgi:RimJ/RimL family protein N-acetyltransferase
LTLAKLFRGKWVHLSAIEDGDVPSIARWYADSDFGRMWDAFPAYPKRASAVKKWIDGHDNELRSFLFGIRLTSQNDSLVGFVEIDGIDWSNHTAWLGIAIGERNYWGRGYGTEASTLALDFCFKELNLHRMSATVFSYNTRSRSMCERLGFKLEGAMREHVYRDGRRYDMLMFGILRPEWEARQTNEA